MLLNNGLPLRRRLSRARDSRRGQSVFTTDLRLVTCVSVRAWAMLSAIRCSREPETTIVDALEWSLEMGRQVFHRREAGFNASPLLEPYARAYGHSLRVEHAALAQSRRFE